MITENPIGLLYFWDGEWNFLITEWEIFKDDMYMGMYSCKDFDNLYKEGGFINQINRNSIFIYFCQLKQVDHLFTHWDSLKPYLVDGKSPAVRVIELEKGARTIRL